MGEISEYYRDLEIDNMFNPPTVRVENYDTWRTKEGDYINLCDMETKHIKNCINLIQKRKDGWRSDWIKPLKKELLNRQ